MIADVLTWVGLTVPAFVIAAAVSVARDDIRARRATRCAMCGGKVGPLGEPEPADSETPGAYWCYPCVRDHRRQWGRA